MTSSSEPREAVIPEPMTALEYRRQIVDPTVHEFNIAKNDRRRAVLACLTVLSLIDFVFHERHENIIHADEEAKAYTAAQKDIYFRALRAFALAAKHSRTKNEDDRSAQVHAASRMRPYFLGINSWPMFLTTDALCVRHCGRMIDISEALSRTLEIYERDFPEITPTAPPP